MAHLTDFDIEWIFIYFGIACGTGKPFSRMFFDIFLVFQVDFFSKSCFYSVATEFYRLILRTKNCSDIFQFIVFQLIYNLGILKDIKLCTKINKKMSQNCTVCIGTQNTPVKILLKFCVDGTKTQGDR